MFWAYLHILRQLWKWHWMVFTNRYKQTIITVNGQKNIDNSMVLKIWPSLWSSQGNMFDLYFLSGKYIMATSGLNGMGLEWGIEHLTLLIICSGKLSSIIVCTTKKKLSQQVPLSICQFDNLSKWNSLLLLFSPIGHHPPHIWFWEWLLLKAWSKMSVPVNLSSTGRWFNCYRSIGRAT